jgi:phosphoglycerate dehydrogenase-like enzyme
MTVPDANRATHQPRPPRHRAILSAAIVPLPAGRRPTPGPIAVLPVPSQSQSQSQSQSPSQSPELESESQSESAEAHRAARLFTEAVTDAGGTLAPLSSETRGLVWLSYSRSDELGEILAAHPQIGWVQLPWAGVDAFSGILATHDRPDLIWTSAKGAYAQPVAEHALALTLALLRVLHTRARATAWDAVPAGRSLYGRNVVIIGAGGIALELISLLAPFGVHVTVVRRSETPVAEADRTVPTLDLPQVLPGADVVVVAAALTGDTRHLIGAAELAAMKREAVLVNIARGGLVDTDALTAALASATIAGAGLDVTDPEPLPDGHPLWAEPRAIVTCHSADTPEMTTPLLAERVRINVEAFLSHGRFEGVVDPGAGY